MADAVRPAVVSFDRMVGPNGSVGQIDVETRHAIVEVTEGDGGKKYQQALRFKNDSRINPEQKAVVIYGPDLPTGLVKLLNRSGIKVAKSLPALKAVLRELGEEV